MVQLDSEASGVSAVPDAGHLVEVFFARSRSEADEVRSLLVSSNIAAEIESCAAATSGRGVAVLVPSEKLVEASEVLSVRGEDEDEDFEDEESDDEEEFDDDFDDDDDDLDDEDEDEEFEDDDEI